MFVCHLIWLLTLFNIGCISTYPARKDDDGSTSLSSLDSQNLRKFDRLSFNRKNNYITKDQIKYELIKSSDIQQLFSANKLTLVLIWASWCGASQEALFKVIENQDKIVGNNINLLIVAQNFNLQYMSEILFNKSMKYQTYIIDPNVYGRDEVKKQNAFGKLLCPSCRVKFDGTVPRLLVFNQKGKVVLDEPGIKFKYQQLESLLKDSEN